MSDFIASPWELGNVTGLLLRHKKKIVFCPLAALTVCVLVLVFAPRSYRSEARLFLRVGRESVGIDPTATTGQTLPLQAVGRQDEVKSAIEVFRSRSVIARAVDEIGPDVVLNGFPSPSPQSSNPWIDFATWPIRSAVSAIQSLDSISEREAAIVKISRKLNISAERQSTVISVDYDADSPQLAQLVCQAVTDAAREAYMRVHRSGEAQPFLSEQQEILRQQLDDALEALRSAKNEMGLASVEQRRTTLEAQFSAVGLERLSTAQQLATSQARITDLEQTLAAMPERQISSKKHVPSHAADLVRDQLYALQVRALDLTARYSESHPAVLSAKEQLAEAESLAAEQALERTETTDEINPIHRELLLELKRERSQTAGLKARLAALDEQKAAIMAELQSVNANDLKIDRLERDAELARSKFLQYARTAEEARMDQALETEKISNVSVIHPATLAEKPIRPNKLIVVLGSFVLAFASTGAWVLLSEQLHVGRVSAAPAEESLAPIAPVGIPHRRAATREVPVRANGDH